MLTWGNSPMAKETPADWQAKICHATLTAGSNELAGVDDPFEQYEPPRGFQLLLEIDQADDAERIFQALAENGRVIMPMQKTFWAARFGVLVDQFNVRWEINLSEPRQ